MSYKKTVSSIVLGFIVFFQLKAQNNPLELRSIIPPSATVSSLGKYGEIPVSLNTGIPRISIPLYEINDGPLSFPISISYHAGGIKVEEIASAVGLGWALNAGGMVSRQVRGLPDEQWGWSLPVQERIATILQNGTTNEKIAMKTALATGMKDSEGDLYSYSMNGQSGKFLFDQTGTIFNYPEKNVSIAPAGVLNGGDGWKIITEDGTMYEFTKYESVSTFSCSGGDQGSRTAWFLTKIKSADTKRQISFTYEDINYQNSYLLAQTKYLLIGGQGGCLNDNMLCAGLTTTYTQRLTRIDFSGGYVKFNYNSTERLDLPGEKSLSQVEIYTTTNTLIKKYDLAYTYFGAGSIDQFGKRLKLVSVTEKSATGQKPPHEFTYEEGIEMPARNSYAQDHWGYYNGKTNNSSLIPGFYYGAPGYSRYIPGEADRNANPATMQACILKKIKYPTGGETLFTYETNTTPDTRIEPPTYNEYYSYSLNQPYSSISSPYETSTFTIPSQGADVQFFVSGLTGSNAYCNHEVNLHCYLIKDNNVSTPYADITDASNGTRLLLSAGTYKLRFTFDYCNTGNLNYSISINAKIPILSELGKRFVGGLRVKEIEDKPGNGGQAIVKKYKYNLISDPSVSSGALVRFPDYEYELEVEKHNYSPNFDCLGGEVVQCSYIVKRSTTNYPLASGQGSYVDYSNVTEDVGDNGEVQHTFMTVSTLPAPWPFPPFEEYDWERGSEVGTKFYAKKNGQLVLSREVGNSYTRVSKGSITGSYKVAAGNPYAGTIPILKVGPCVSGTDMTMVPYTVYRLFFALEFTMDRLYDQNDPTKYAETITNHTYNTDHYQLAQVRSLTSSNDASVKDEVIINKKYPQDYSFTGSPSGADALGIKKLKDLHIVNIPVEEYSYRQKRNISTNAVTDQRVVGGMIMTFKSDNPYPAEVFRLETNATIPLSTYGNGSSISSNAFIKNANSTVANAYRSAVVFNSYDDKGNLLQQQKANDVVISYLWGYGKNYPVAQVVGATHSTISGYVTQSTLDVPASDAALRTHLNSIRTSLGSSKALVTTYTYKPLIGQTSVTDPNNRTNYYEFDDFGRLSFIRDQDNNILKKYCYNYFGQTENCVSYVNTDQSGNYYSQNCGAQAPSAYYVSIPVGMFTSSISVQDANSQAITYGQQQANQYGTCSSLVSLYYNTDFGASYAPANCYTAHFHNVSTNIDYSFPIGATGYYFLGNVPAGTYDVVIDQPNGICDYGDRVFEVGCGNSTNAAGSAYLYSVVISGSCNTVNIW